MDSKHSLKPSDPPRIVFWAHFLKKKWPSWRSVQTICPNDELWVVGIECAKKIGQGVFLFQSPWFFLSSPSHGQTVRLFSFVVFAFVLCCCVWFALVLVFLRALGCVSATTLQIVAPWVPSATTLSWRCEAFWRAQQTEARAHLSSHSDRLGKVFRSTKHIFILFSISS